MSSPCAAPTATSCRRHAFAEAFAWVRDASLARRAPRPFPSSAHRPVLRYFEANGTAYTVMDSRRAERGALAAHRRSPVPDDVRRLADCWSRLERRPPGLPPRDSSLNIITGVTSFRADRFGAAPSGANVAHETGVLRRNTADEQYRSTAIRARIDIYSAPPCFITPHRAAAALRRARGHRSVPSAGDVRMPIVRAAFLARSIGAVWRRAASGRDCPGGPLFGPSIARVADAPTQRRGAHRGATPRLGGSAEMSIRPRRRRRARAAALWVVC